MLCAVMYRTSGRSAVEHSEVVRPDRCGFQFRNVPCSDCRRLGWTGESVKAKMVARRPSLRRFTLPAGTGSSEEASGGVVMTYYHAQVRGPAGQFYQCEHNHRTETAAIACANSSATRQMASIVWNRSAAKAEHAAALAMRREEERVAAQDRRIAAQAALAAAQAQQREEERAAAQVRQLAAEAAKAAKAAKRAAKLAAMSPERAWRQMTPAERLQKTAEMELEIYGQILTPEAESAYVERHGKPQAANIARSVPSSSGRPSGPPGPVGLPEWIQSWLPAK